MLSLKSFFLVALLPVAGACISCDVQITDGGSTGGGLTYVALDRADAVITIRQSSGSATAEVDAQITSPLGVSVVFQRGQAVRINSVALTGPDSAGYFHATVPVAETYEIAVTEPSRGVETTTVGSPAAFAITAPVAGETASLSGFTVTWSNPDPAFTVLLTLKQTILGDQTTHNFGPFADSGSQTFAATDLADFRQGADLLIRITRSSEADDIAGFKSGSVSIEHQESVSIEPGP